MSNAGVSYFLCAAGVQHNYVKLIFFFANHHEPRHATIDPLFILIIIIWEKKHIFASESIAGMSTQHEYIFGRLAFFRRATVAAVQTKANVGNSLLLCVRAWLRTFFHLAFYLFDETFFSVS